MYKVLVADDHVQVLDFLTQMIPWNDLQLQLIASCVDGCEALEKSKEQIPDILITDIGMPNMNGLDLIEKLRSMNPGIKAVILSCHEDFPYAQRAVKLRVNEYVLKESLRQEQLILILRQLVEQLTQEDMVQRSQLKLQNEVEQSRSIMKSKFLCSLIEQPILNEAGWADKAETYGILLGKGVQYMPIICVIDRYIELVTERYGSDNILDSVLDNALSELIQSKGILLFQLNSQQFLLLYPYPKTIKINVFDEMKVQLKSIQSSLLGNLKISVSFFFNEICGTFIELKRQIEVLQHMNDFRFYTVEGAISKVQPIPLSDEDLFTYYTEALQDLRKAIMLEDDEKLEIVMQKWITHIRNSFYPADLVRGWFMKIVMDLELKFTIMQNFVINYNAEVLHRSLYEMDTLFQLEEWFRQFLCKKILFVSKIRHTSLTNRKEVSSAQRYVKTHLHEKISMEEMAIKLQMNSTYFSKVFKKETGETFIEFVNNQKMEHAAELLTKTNLTIEQIAGKLGYEHTSYFIKLFRVFTGMSPLQYRREM